MRVGSSKPALILSRASKKDSIIFVGILLNVLSLSRNKRKEASVPPTTWVLGGFFFELINSKLREREKVLLFFEKHAAMNNRLTTTHHLSTPRHFKLAYQV